jgi:hypothetical protein
MADLTWADMRMEHVGRHVAVYQDVPPCGAPGCPGKTVIWRGTVSEGRHVRMIRLDGSESIERFMDPDDRVEFDG